MSINATPAEHLSMSEVTEKKPRILVVDDEIAIRELLA